MKTPARLFFALTLAVSTQVMAQAPIEVVRIQDYPGLGNLLTRVAIAEKFCEKHGIRCELRTVPSAPIGMQMLLAGDLDVQMGPPEVIFNAVARGAKVKVPGTFHGTPMTFLMASSRLATPNEPRGYPAVMQDLRGKRVGVTARGAGTEFQLASLLKGAGMSPSDVTILAVGSPDTALGAIRSGQVDAVMLFEPMGGFCEVQKVCRVLVDPRKGQGPSDLTGNTGATTLQVIRTDYAEKKPQVVAALQSALRDSEIFMQAPANRPAVLKVLRDTFSIAVPDAEAVLSVVLRDSLGAFTARVDPKALQFGADAMVRNGQLARPIDVSTLMLLPTK